MNNEKMLKFALETLQQINHKDTENVMVDNTVYDDGSNTISINVTLPKKVNSINIDGFTEPLKPMEEPEMIRSAGDKVTIK